MFGNKALSYMHTDSFQTIVQNFNLVKDFDKLSGSWDEIVKNYREIEDEIKKHGQENSAKIFTEGSTFDKVQTVSTHEIK